MSPCVSASVETGNETCTVLDCPASSVTRVKPDQPLRRHHDAADRLGHVDRHDVGPARDPVLVTVNVAVAVPFLDTVGVTDRFARGERRVGQAVPERVERVVGVARPGAGARQLVEELRLVAER